MTKKHLTEITGKPERLAPIPEKIDETHLATMYGNADDDTDEETVPSPLKKINDEKGMTIITSHPRFNMVKIGDVTYNFPNAKYMEALEKRVIDQDREILRMSNKNKVMQGKLNQIVGEINDLWKEVDKKINSRDML